MDLIRRFNIKKFLSRSKTYRINFRFRDVEELVLVCKLYENEEWYLLTVITETGVFRSGANRKRRKIYRSPTLYEMRRATKEFFLKSVIPVVPVESYETRGEMRDNKLVRMYVPKIPLTKYVDGEFPYRKVRGTDSRLPICIKLTPETP